MNVFGNIEVKEIDDIEVVKVEVVSRKIYDDFHDWDTEDYVRETIKEKEKVRVDYEDSLKILGIGSIRMRWR